jgi:cytochrome c peroxidase
MNPFQKYAWIAAPALALLTVTNSWTTSDDDQQPVSGIDQQINKVAQQTLAEGRQVFRFDTFGDEDFWGIHEFQANRAPDKRYRTSPLKGLWTHTSGGFYHDGRFATLGDVVTHYDTTFTLRLTEQEKDDLVEYLKSL